MTTTKHTGITKSFTGKPWVNDMGRIIIDNQSALPDAEAIRVVARVIDDGRISGGGRCYCYATVFKAPFVAVYAKVNKSSDKFIVSDD